MRILFQKVIVKKKFDKIKSRFKITCNLRVICKNHVFFVGINPVTRLCNRVITVRLFFNHSFLRFNLTFIFIYPLLSIKPELIN